MRPEWDPLNVHDIESDRKRAPTSYEVKKVVHFVTSFGIPVPHVPKFKTMGDLDNWRRSMIDKYL